MTQDDPDLLEHMRRSGTGNTTGASGGIYCQVCNMLSRLYVTNRDGQPITHARNYCSGCGHVVCDRHTLDFAEDDPRHHHHGVRDHSYVEVKP